MAKKKQDTYEEAKEQGTSLEDFIIPQRIKAFAETYQPCQEDMATETFDETRLRNFFKAWPTSLGDPLSLYLNKLEDYNFHLKVGRTGELAIFVIERQVGGGAAELLLHEGKPDGTATENGRLAQSVGTGLDVDAPSTVARRGQVIHDGSVCYMRPGGETPGTVAETPDGTATENGRLAQSGEAECGNVEWRSPDYGWIE